MRAIGQRRAAACLLLSLYLYVPMPRAAPLRLLAHNVELCIQ